VAHANAQERRVPADETFMVFISNVLHLSSPLSAGFGISAERL
jgi:hypothetical protein